MVSRVLVVGAGGIGCELLKQLFLVTPAPVIDVIDLDTIETSNLSRQFLFHRADRGKHKATLSLARAARIGEGGEGRAFVGSVLDWPAARFSGYSAVFTALDNAQARRHVARACAAVGVVMVDGGTGGQVGQAQAHVPGVTDCYECRPQAVQATFPVCTIRTRPTEPKHCLVWARLAFDHLAAGAEDDVLTAAASGELRGSFDAEGAYRASFSEALGPWDRAVAAAPARLAGSAAEAAADEEALWPAPWHAATLRAALAGLAARQGPIAFDKDDDEAMLAVHALANLRAACFGVRLVSLYEARGIAGNIVASLCTTNAIVAAAMVHEWLAARDGSRPPRCTRVFASPAGRSLIMSSRHGKPNPKCLVCAAAARAPEVHLDFDRTTVGDVHRKVALEMFRMGKDAAMVFGPDGVFDEEDWDDVTLRQAEIAPGDTLTLRDSVIRITVILLHKDQEGAEGRAEQGRQRGDDDGDDDDVSPVTEEALFTHAPGVGPAAPAAVEDPAAFERKRTDRQRRVWGGAVQRRIASTSVALALGAGAPNALAAELAKNLALVGVKSITMVTSGAASSARTFLTAGIFDEEEDDKRVVERDDLMEAALATLCVINPSVEYCVASQAPRSATVLITTEPGQEAAALASEVEEGGPMVICAADHPESAEVRVYLGPGTVMGKAKPLRAVPPSPAPAARGDPALGAAVAAAVIVNELARIYKGEEPGDNHDDDDDEEPYNMIKVQYGTGISATTENHS
jgi:ubiquitin-like 1-activating enzyme E1 B